MESLPLARAVCRAGFKPFARQKEDDRPSLGIKIDVAEIGQQPFITRVQHKSRVARICEGRGNGLALHIAPGLAQVTGFQIVKVCPGVQADGAGVEIENSRNPFARPPTDLIIPGVNSSEQLGIAPVSAIGAGRPKQASGGIDTRGLAAAIAGVEEQESLSWYVPGLGIGKVGLLHTFELINGPGFHAPVDVGWAAGAVGGGKDPQVAKVINLQGRVIMRIGGVLVEKNSWPGDHPRRVIVTGDHVEEFLPVCCGMCGGASIDKERFVHCPGINGDRSLLVGVGGKSTAVFIFVFIPSRLVVIPDSSKAVVEWQDSCEGLRAR